VTLHLFHVKTIAGMLLPPIVPMALARLRNSIQRLPDGSLHFDFRPHWAVVRNGWSRDDSRARGWLDPSIVETQRRRWPTYSELIRGRGPLGFHLFTTGSITTTNESAHNVFMTFAYVVARAALRRNPVLVLDWGGGIGYYALIAQALLPEITVDYVVRDLPGLMQLGRELMPTVKFEDDEAACFARSYDVVMAISSIQYTEDWRSLLSRLAHSVGQWLYLSRVPTVRRAKSYAVVQRPHQFGYQTEYISWVINRDELVSHLTSLGLTLEREFRSGGVSRSRNPPDIIEDLGFLFRKDGASERRVEFRE
jgi:putative methyltransferase (TIGR04325 family)